MSEQPPQGAPIGGGDFRLFLTRLGIQGLLSLGLIQALEVSHQRAPAPASARRPAAARRLLLLLLERHSRRACSTPVILLKS